MSIFIDADGKKYESSIVNEKTVWTLIEEQGVSASRQKDIELLRAKNKDVRVKVTLLDINYLEVDSLTGHVESSSYDIDAESDIRRTCSLTMSIPIKEQIELDFEKTWNKRMVELSCGIYSVEDDDYVWYKLGRMLMTSGNSTFDATTQEVNLNLVDLMASMTSERGNQIGSDLVIPAGSNVREAIITIVTTFSDYKRYDVCSFDDTIPYDIESSIGAFAFDILKDIRDLFPYYEMFYDVNGVFTVREIPMKINDPIDIGADIIDGCLIKESRDVDFAQVFNTTEIHGKELTSLYTASQCTSSGVIYSATVADESLVEYKNGDTYTIVPPTNSVQGQKLNINSIGDYAIYTVNGAGTTYTAISPGEMEANIPYCIRYFEEKFILEGELRIRCILQEVTSEPSQAIKDAYKASNNCNDVKWNVNPTSPFAVTVQNGFLVGEKRQVLNGGEYDGITTTQLAYERASYENWLRCRLQDTVELEMILIPWMDVNDKIQYTSPITNTMGTWLVRSISYDFSNWTMTVKASRFYPTYPWN